MSKKITKKSSTKPTANITYICGIYGGFMKQGAVKFIAVDDLPEEHKMPDYALERYKCDYGSETKARYIKVVNEYTGSDNFKRLKDFLSTHDGIHNYGDIYELNVPAMTKLMKDAFGVKVSSSWGLDVVEEETVTEPVEKKKTTNTKKQKEELIDIESDDEIEATVGIEEEENETENEIEEPIVDKKVKKQAVKKSAPKK
jgi:hypothetical protein